MRADIEIIKKIEKDGNETFEIIIYHLRLSPESEQDKEKISNLEDDLDHEFYVEQDNKGNKRINIIF